MTTRSIVRGGLVLGATLLVAGAAWAQASDPARPQVQTFEMALGRAIETGSRNFATRAAEIAPELMPIVAFAAGEAPSVTGVAVHDMGLYVFHVQVPGIDLRLRVMNLMASRQVGGPARPRAVSSGGVESNTVVEPDPMGPAPAPSAKPDFLAEFRNQVREALIDAIVDNAGVLPMTSSETLLVVAGGVDSPVGNPIYRQPTPRLVLRAKASDLAAFRESRITRDEVKRRVLASSF